MHVGTYKKTRTRSFAKEKRHSALRTALSALLTFFLASCKLFGEMLPFGIAFYAAEYTASPPFVVGAIALIAALFPRFLPICALKYALSIVLFSLIAIRFGGKVLSSAVRRGALMGICVFASGLLLLAGGQILLYDCFALLLEGGIVLAAVCLFAEAKKVIRRKTAQETPLDTLAVSALLGAAILGINSLLSLTGLHFTIPLSVFAVLLLAHENGMALGAVAGTTIGLLATLESGNPVLGAFAAAGMAAGYFSRYGRAGGAIGFLIANSVITFYSGGTSEMVLNLYEILSPALLYLIFPKSILTYFAFEKKAAASAEEELRAHLSTALHSKAEGFRSLSGIFTAISQGKLFSANNAAGEFFEKTARKACDGCDMLSACWKKEFHRTYAAFFVMLEICTREGSVKSDDIPISLSQKCIHHTRLLHAFNTSYVLYKTERLWESRIRECRAVTARQFSSMADILGSMERDIKTGTSYRRVTESFLRSRLGEAGVPISSLAVSERANGDLSVLLRTSSAADADSVTDILSDALDARMELTEAAIDHLTFCAVRRMHLDIAIRSASMDQSNKSGDSADSLFLDNGFYLLAVSDGMGSGERAGRDSRATLDMLKKLFQCGFDTDAAIGLVNSVLILKSSEEAFSTIDLILVNTRNFEAEFIKAGAACSFIKRGNTVHTIRCGTLPAGILETPDIGREKKRLAAGDILIMLTDGVSDADRTRRDPSWPEEAIRTFSGESPDALCRLLLNLAREKSGGRVPDDMTVLCAVVKENV